MKIVILPGLDGTGTLLSDVEARLRQSHRVVTVQYPVQQYSYQDLQTHVEENLPKEDFIIVAESFSGPLAVMIASKHPIGLKGVVFVATFAKSPRRLPAFLAHIVGIMPTQSRLLASLVLPLVMGKWSDKKFAATFSHAMTLVPAATLARRLRAVLKVNVVDKLAGLKVPIVYLSATQDKLVPPQMALDFKAVSAPVIAVEGPHFLLQVNALDCAKHILDFAARIPPCRSV